LTKSEGKEQSELKISISSTSIQRKYVYT